MNKSVKPNPVAQLAAMMAAAVENPESANWSNIDTGIRFEGKQITLPADPNPMDYDSAIETIGRIRDQENQEYDVRELVAGAPWDTAVAVYKAMQDIYGVVIASSIQTFFGEIKPDFITVLTGHLDEDRVQIPVGKMVLPGVEQPVFIRLSAEGTMISGTVRRRDRAALVEIANRARRIINTDSIYKGKAIRLNVDADGDIELSAQPEFLDLTKVKEADMIHTRETEQLIRTNIFAPLKHTQACRDNRVPLKRGILLEGKYGTGKSLTARITAKVGNDNGWTFIMLNRSQGLKSAIEFARQYQPCVIFAEDIDRAADRSDEGVNDLVNLLDGLISKDMEMMVVLTTNYIENIDKSLLRPGRFDAIISIDSPDAETAERIVRAYAGALLDEGEDLTQVGAATSGMIPATIREVVERAKLFMLTEGRNVLTSEDLYASAIGMQRHSKLLAPKAADKSASERFAQAFTELVVKGFESGENTEENMGALVKIQAGVLDARQRLSRLSDKVDETQNIASAGAESAEKGRRETIAARKITTEIRDIVS